MIWIGLAMACLLGYMIVNLISADFSMAEKWGLSFLIGIGMETVFMFVLDVLSLEFNALILFLLSVLLIAVLGWMQRYSLLEGIRNHHFSVRKPDFGRLNYFWWVMVVAIGFLLFGSIWKSLYWPTISYDSVAGYDLMGRVIAAEGKIRVSLFDSNSQGLRGIYPPLVEGSFAFAYLFGATSSKIITSLTFLSLIFIFYALLRRYVNSNGAILFTLLLVITPEMLVHSALSLTNMPLAAYAGPGLIYLYLWFDQQQRRDLWIGSILLGLGIWARNDGIVFNAAGLLLLIYYAIRNKTWKDAALYFTISFLPLISWTLYLTYNIGIVQDRFVNHLYWDGERLAKLFTWSMALVGDNSLYGLTFYLFAAAVILNIRHLLKNHLFLLLVILASFLMYAGIFYQLDEVKQPASLLAMMQYSFKRGLVSFVPLVLFYAAANITMQRLLDWVENFRTGQLQARREVTPGGSR